MTRSFMLGNLEIHEDGTVYRIKNGEKREVKAIITNIKGNDREIGRAHV